MRGIAASWVLLGDGETPPIRAGAVVVDAAGSMVAVGVADALRAQYADARWEPTRDAVLVPGLVNAHTHLELSALRGRVPGGRGFAPWVSALMEARGQSVPESDAEAIDAAVSELLAAGTAAVGEVTNSLASVPALAGRPLVARVFAEVFGLGRGAAEAMRDGLRGRIAALGVLPGNVSVTLAPHTAYTLHVDVLAALSAEAREAGALTTLHLAEHAAERAFLRDGSGPFADFLRARGVPLGAHVAPGMDAVRHARACGALGPHVLAVHLADAREDELAIVAESQTPVVLCPRSNLHIELRFPPLELLLRAGIRPGLGTDSLASAPSLDVLAEARALRARFPRVSARALVAMATGWGAQALGVGPVAGTLAPGRAPGVVAFAHAPGAVPEDPEAWLLSERADTRAVLVPAGRALRDTTQGPVTSAPSAMSARAVHARPAEESP
jgi:cytosine/adenosine deaminase-related metal-dependent hydrolase